MSRRGSPLSSSRAGKVRRGDRGMSQTTYRILSCDGGGIRGVITAKLLQALDPSVIKTSICLPEPRPVASSRSVSRAEFRSIRSSNCTAPSKPARRSFSPICLWPSRTGSVGHLRLANRRSSPPRKRPRTSGTGYASWGRCCCFRNIAAMDCGNCWPPIFLTLRSPMSGRSGTKALLLRASN